LLPSGFSAYLRRMPGSRQAVNPSEMAVTATRMKKPTVMAM
jgi:hypothetical protein